MTPPPSAVVRRSVRAAHYLGIPRGAHHNSYYGAPSQETTRRAPPDLDVVVVVVAVVAAPWTITVRARALPPLRPCSGAKWQFEHTAYYKTMRTSVVLQACRLSVVIVIVCANYHSSTLRRLTYDLNVKN